MATEFIVEIGSEPKARLRYNNQDYRGYFLIDHGNDAEVTEEKLFDQKGIADCFPALPDGFLAFRCFPTSFGFKLRNDPGFRTRLLCGRFMTEYFKLALRSLGFLALHCYLDGVNLDFDLQRILITGNDIIRVKGIALKGNGETFDDWKAKLVKLYQEIGSLCYVDISSQEKDPEFELLMKFFKQSKHPGDINSILSSWLLWPKAKRVRLLFKMGDILDGPYDILFREAPKTFKEISNWRVKMFRDTKLEPLITKFNLVNIFTPDRVHYLGEEAKLVFVFLRSNLAHFNSLHFRNEVAFIAYLDQNFSKIMFDVYQFCSKAEKEEKFKFNFEEL